MSPRPGQHAGPRKLSAAELPAATAREFSLDASEPANAQTEDVVLRAGEVLKVQVAADEPVELVVLSQRRGIVGQETAKKASSIIYMADAAERVRVQTRPAAGGWQIGPAPAARLMISVEPAGSAESSLEGDGAAYLNARQHLLLNLFGVNPTSLHPQSGLELAKALDVLEAVAQSAAMSPDALPSAIADHVLTVARGQAGAIEHATYRLESSDSSLSLATTFDASTGELHCVLGFEHISGVRVHGALTHTVAPADGRAVSAADPVADYLASDPGAHGEIDDFSDVVAGAEDSDSEEGIGSFVGGALAGDFSDNDSWSALGGQVAMGFVPIAGQIADARDIAAAGSDVFAGEEGAWARLGISIIAVVPGLDFLKGGSKANKKSLREASENAIEGTSKAGLKRLGKRMSKAAAARATKELKRLAVARQEMLARMQGLLLDDGISEATKHTIRKVRNAVQDHLQPSDLSGALRDKHGLPVRKSGSGVTWDHLREVRDVVRSIESTRRNLRRELHRMEPGSNAYGTLSREIHTLSEMSKHVKSFLEIK